MIKLTVVQQHVLRNIERVCTRPYKLNVANPISRYQLDERDCTLQVNALGAKGLIEETGLGWRKVPKKIVISLRDLPRPKGSLLQ